MKSSKANGSHPADSPNGSSRRPASFNVVQEDGQWVVRRRKRLLGTFPDRGAAVGFARSLALPESADVFFQSYSGLYRHKLSMAEEDEMLYQLLKRDYGNRSPDDADRS